MKHPLHYKLCCSCICATLALLFTATNAYSQTQALGDLLRGQYQYLQQILPKTVKDNIPPNIQLFLQSSKKVIRKRSDQRNYTQFIYEGITQDNTPIHLKIKQLDSWLITEDSVLGQKPLTQVGHLKIGKHNVYLRYDQDLLWYEGRRPKKGKLIRNDGVMYDGDLKNNKKHGQGTQTDPSGYKYVGEWKKNMRHGQGTQTDPSGYKYVGEWKKNMRHGQGIQTDPNGQQHVGEWKKDMRHGQGTQTDPSGYKYVGEWKKDMRHGQGTYTSADGVSYTGTWKKGVLNGEVSVRFPDRANPIIVSFKKGVLEHPSNSHTILYRDPSLPNNGLPTGSMIEQTYLTQEELTQKIRLHQNNSNITTVAINYHGDREGVYLQDRTRLDVKQLRLALISSKFDKTLECYSCNSYQFISDLTKSKELFQHMLALKKPPEIVLVSRDGILTQNSGMNQYYLITSGSQSTAIPHYISKFRFVKNKPAKYGDTEGTFTGWVEGVYQRRLGDDSPHPKVSDEIMHYGEFIDTNNNASEVISSGRKIDLYHLGGEGLRLEDNILGTLLRVN